MTANLLAAALLATTAFAGLDDLQLTLQPHTRELYLGDSLFVKVVLKNAGKEDVEVPNYYLRELGTLDFVTHSDDFLTFHFAPDDAATGGGGTVVLPPGGEIVLYDHLRVPRIGDLDGHFWSGVGQETISIAAAVKLGPRLQLWSSGVLVNVRPRPEPEMALLKRLHKDRPQGVDRPTHDLPLLSGFWVRDFLFRVSTPQTLDTLETQLSPGGLRDVVHITRLAQEIATAQDDQERLQAAVDDLYTWMESLPEVERIYLSDRIVLYFLHEFELPDAAERFWKWMPERAQHSRLETLQYLRGQQKNARKQ